MGLTTDMRLYNKNQIEDDEDMGGVHMRSTKRNARKAFLCKTPHSAVSSKLGEED